MRGAPKRRRRRSASTEVERKIEVLAAEIETMKLGEARGRTADRSTNGMGPAASKIYRGGNGLAIGGYGELVYRNFAARLENGSRSQLADEADLQRAVLYFGYKFNDRFLFNSEVEFEHAVTASDKDGETEVEFAYGDYLWKPQANFRAGVVLMPVGLLNEYHEPTVFLGVRRNGVETAIIPTTWREAGFGLYGEAGPWRYRTYLTNGLDASRFAADGLGEGSGEGSHAKAEDPAWVGRLDFTGVPGLLAGGSAFTGDTGQGLRDDRRPADRRPDEPLRRARRLALAGAPAPRPRGAQPGRRRRGDQRRPGPRRRRGDRQGAERRLRRGRLRPAQPAPGQPAAAASPSRASSATTPRARSRRASRANPANDVHAITFGFNYYPIDQLVLKANFLRVRNQARTGQNEFQLGLGYVF